MPSHSHLQPDYLLLLLCAGAGATSRGPGRDLGAAPALPVPLAAARQAPWPHLPRSLECLVRPSEGRDRLRDR